MTFESKPLEGISILTRQKLMDSWKEIRQNFRRYHFRDIVDFIDYEVDPNVWIERLIRRVHRGTYEPRNPQRYAIGKSRGFNRWMTLPEVPDLVLFHAISTITIEKAQTQLRRRRHVYFARDQITSVERDSRKSQDDESDSQSEYGINSFRIWLRFDQYRRHIMLSREYPYIVVTDITNFFDSIAHAQLEYAVHELGFSRSFVGLLQVLLERLMFRESYSVHPRVGIPVDDFDCSRCLAHLVLFPHDDRMIEIVGEDGYARWMDDQVLGVRTEAEGYYVLGEVDASLRRMYLSPNSSKSKVMSLREAQEHYHFETNDRLDSIQRLWDRRRHPVGRALNHQRGVLQEAWQHAQDREGEGEWRKVLKRFYLGAGRLGLDIFVDRADDDVLEDPTLATRAAHYLRTLCSGSDFVDRALSIISDERFVNADVKREFAEELLKLDVRSLSASDRSRLREFARSIIRGEFHRTLAADVGALLLLRFGDRRSASTMLKALDSYIETSAARGMALVVAAFGGQYAERIAAMDADSMQASLWSAVRLVRRIQSDPLPSRARDRMQLRTDSMSGEQYLDTRVLLITLLYCLNDRSKAQIRQLIKRRWVPHLRLGDKRLLTRYELL